METEKEVKKWKPYNTKRIINNLKKVFENNNIELLQKSTYNFLYQMGGFIAHYNHNGFMCHYSDLRDLINDLKNSSDVNNPSYYREDYFQNEQKEFYISKAETLKQIKPLIEQYEQKINKGCGNIERQQDINHIKFLMNKHNIKEVV